MSQNKVFRQGPTTLANAVANILNPGTTTGGVGSTAAPYNNLMIILTHIRIVNRTAAAVNVSLFIGATGAGAAGTEFAWSAYPVPANGFVEWFGRVPLFTTDFLTGFASTASALTMESEGEIGVA